MTGAHPPTTRAERQARLVTLAAALVAVATLLGLLTSSSGRGASEIDLVARQPQAGGWSRERIVVRQGDRVRLRVRSEDVVHGFAIGRLGVDAGPIEPGKVVTVEFVADHPGEYTYYCTTWCDPSHPRMRGVLEVQPAATTPGEPAAGPTPHEHPNPDRAAPTVPSERPSALRGQALFAARCASCHEGTGSGAPAGPPLDRGRLWDRSPTQAFAGLTEERGHARASRGWSEQQRWDALAHVWLRDVSADELTAGRGLFRVNCAACHGEEGRGDGPGGRHTSKKPADFADLRRMLAGTSALYEETIRRGGMGSGMPYWGNIFTGDQVRSLVAVVWSFAMSPDR